VIAAAELREFDEAMDAGCSEKEARRGAEAVRARLEAAGRRQEAVGSGQEAGEKSQAGSPLTACGDDGVGACGDDGVGALRDDDVGACGDDDFPSGSLCKGQPRNCGIENWKLKNGNCKLNGRDENIEWFDGLEWVSVKWASERLCVSDKHVRQLLNERL